MGQVDQKGKASLDSNLPKHDEKYTLGHPKTLPKPQIHKWIVVLENILEASSIAQRAQGKTHSYLKLCWQVDCP